MSTRVLPGVIAVLGGIALAAVLLMPFVVRRYRRRGELGWRPALLGFAFLVYAVAIVTYTMLPLPQIDVTWCAAHTELRHPQANLLQFVTDIAKEQRGSGLRALLANPAVQQTVFNVALFVPLGAFLRHGFRRGVATTIAIGFGVSLLVECTQLTGNWFLFPCPYRVFDVDDLAANTIGTAIGVLLAPLLTLVEGRGSGLAPDVPRPVTTGRRLMGMVLDLLSVTILVSGFGVVVAIIGELAGGEQPWVEPLVAVGTALITIGWLAVPALRSGATPGQRAVLLRRVSPDGRPVPLGRGLAALLTGTFGAVVFSWISSVVELAGFLSFLLFVLAPIVAWRSRGHRGFSGVVSGLDVVDSRATADPAEHPLPAHRR